MVRALQVPALLDNTRLNLPDSGTLFVTPFDVPSKHSTRLTEVSFSKSKTTFGWPGILAAVITGKDPSAPTEKLILAGCPLIVAAKVAV